MSHGNAFRPHAIKADIHRVRIGKKYWNFTFSPAWGPLLVDEWAQPIDNTALSDEGHPFWDKFEEWQALTPHAHHLPLSILSPGRRSNPPRGMAS